MDADLDQGVMWGTRYRWFDVVPCWRLLSKDGDNRIRGAADGSSGRKVGTRKNNSGVRNDRPADVASHLPDYRGQSKLHPERFTTQF